MKIARLSSISLGHFAIDILNSSVIMVLTAYAAQFSLSVSQIGLGALIYTSAASLSQPLFGLLADRLRGRWMGALGLLWTMLFYMSIPFAPSFAVLVTVLTIGAFGSAAFHPVGVVNATDAGGNRPTTSTSIFFLLGQSGLAVGPMIAGFILERYGLAGMPFVAIAMLPAVLLMAFYLRAPIDTHDHGEGATQKQSQRPRVSPGALVLIALAVLILLRAAAHSGFMTLLPRYFDDQGISPAVYGRMVGTFTLAGAIGTFGGGILGDMINRRVLMFVAILAAIPFSVALLRLDGVGYYVSAILAGALMAIPHSILLVMAQEMLPNRKGFVGGAVLGFMFAGGAAVTWLASLIADSVGLVAVLTTLATLPVIAAICVLFLPGRQSPQVDPSLAAAD